MIPAAKAASIIQSIGTATAFAVAACAPKASIAEQPPVVRGFVSGTIDSTTFRDMRAWGATVVRLQIHPGELPWPAQLDQVEARVRAAGAAGLRVVVDMHSAPVKGVNVETPALWDGPDLEPNLIRVWTDLARRLKPYGQTVWGYDLLNEPIERSQMPSSPRQWRPLAIKVIAAIRAIDPTVWIIYEPGPGGLFNGFEGLTPLPDPRVIYSLHFYAPIQFVNQSFDAAEAGNRAGSGVVHYPGWIRFRKWDRARLEDLVAPVVAFQRRYHVPIYVGEFSVVRWAPEPDAAHWLQDAIAMFESHGWSWTYHAFREHNAWSLEDDDRYWVRGDAEPRPAATLSARGAVVKAALHRQ
ncbi:MAG TPA: cellulase family glycosylhydrolase [Gemmatimonadaceae bacterium]|jgi:endoglucanase|nr:cellulase family glycosylhydrolase [Gemmatimonadaceae bacterium]